MTLYNILPPITFFASLGGIILVVSRVVLRVRRQNTVEGRRTHPQQAHIFEMSGKRIEASDIASILKPNRKGVQVMGSRLGMFFSSAKRSGKALAGIRHIPQRAWSLLKIRPLRKKKNAEPKLASLRTRLIQSARNSTAAAREKAITIAGRVGRIRSRVRPAPAQEQPQKQPVKVRLSVQQTQASDITPIQPKVVKKAEEKNKGKSAGTIVDKAQEALQAAQYQRVEELLVPFLAQYPKHSEAYVLLGHAAAHQGAWDEAGEIFEQVARVDPNYPGIDKLVGLTAVKCGKITRALEALKRAHEAAPSDREILEQLLAIARKTDNRALVHSFTAELAEIQK